MDPSPHIKFENSPADSLADSFVSTPGTAYPPLFHDTMNPSEVMTPQSYDENSMFGGSMDGSMAGSPAPAPEKKPVKKRKSWGQQLPEPKTNLPPRKRAKTEDEKEQRRVERVLRNRRAAQSSRERKRQEVEALEAEKRAIERRAQDLEMRLADSEAKRAELQSQLEQYTGAMPGMIAFRGSSAPSPAQSEQIQRAPTPITFSQELFSSSDADNRPISTQPLVVRQPPIQTINLASVSPEIRPVDESSNASSSDMTQHPAAMLCDLQCQSEEQRPWTDTTTFSQILAITLFMTTASQAISTFLIPLGQIVDSLRTGSYLIPTPSILTTIIWLVTTTAPLTPSTSMTSSTKTHSLQPRFTLRIRLLRRLLTSSPNLARPLSDATMVAMRLASEQQLTQACLSNVDANRLDDVSSPNVEALMTLLWAIQCFEKERGHITPKLDVATEVRQAIGELDELFRHRDSMGVSFVPHGRDGDSTGVKAKSLEGWRTAFR